MSRLRRAIHGVASGYVQLAATVAYALASVPLALNYLTTERFGLWALLTTLIGYLSLLDLGMSASIGRHLFDFKDNRDGSKYGSMIKTGCAVLAAQGLIVTVIGILFAPLFSDLMAIPEGLRQTFINLVRLQCVIVAFGFATRIFNYLLLSRQRMDLANYSSVLTLLASFAALWAFFHLGADVYSVIWSGLLGGLVNVAFQWFWCARLKVFPKTDTWGCISWDLFKAVFNYGRDVFLVSLGTQLIMASQTMILTRRLGLESAAAWSVGTRTFNLISQAVWRVTNSAAPALVEMMVRDERVRLGERYRGLSIVVCSLAAYAAISFALCNSAFVHFWTSGRIPWPPVNDLLLGLWLIILTQLNCHNSYVLLTKRIHAMRYVYFLEGLVFVVMAVLVCGWGGVPAIIICSIVCSVCFSGAYGVWRISVEFATNPWDVAAGWMRHAATVIMGYAPVAALAWWLTHSLDVRLRLVACGFVCATAGLFILLRFGLPSELQSEAVRRAPALLRKPLAFAVGSAVT
jgi:O-antigen/teichoic acid export membrane protein